MLDRQAKKKFDEAWTVKKCKEVAKALQKAIKEN